MPECKLKQYSSKVKTRNNNNNKSKENDGINNKKSKIKTTIEIKKIKDYSDDSSLIMTVKNKTLNDSNWKDSFDRLLDTRRTLRKKNIIKKDIRLSYNLDSSVNTSNEKSTNQNPSSFQDSKNITKSTCEKDIGNNNNEQSNSSSILNQTPIYKRKSFLDRFNKLMNKGTRGTRGSKKVKKKSTMASTPLINAATKNGNRKTKKSYKKSAAEMDEMFLLPTISPIRNEPSPLVFNKSLLKSFTASEKKRVWKDLFGMNWSENNKNYINDDCNNKFVSNEQSNLEPLTASSPVQNESNPGVSRNLFSVSHDFGILDDSNVDSTNQKANISKNQLFKDIQNIFQYVKDNSVQSLDNSKNVSLSYQQIQSILDESLSNIEKSLSQFEANKSNKQLPPAPHENDELQPSDIEKLNQTLQTIEDTYNSILEDGELMTSEITDKFHSIDKNLDNLILNNSKQLNLTKTTEENCNKNTSNDLKNTDTNNLLETQNDNIKNVDVDSDVQNNLDNEKSIFENNAFINKLKFLKNCLAFSGEKEAKRSLPVILKDNVKNLVRSNSLNALPKINTRHTLDPSNLQLKNRNNKLLIKESTFQNVKNDKRNSLDFNTRTVRENLNFDQNSVASTSQDFNNQLTNFTETNRSQSSHKFLQNVSNITPKINSTLDALNKTNNTEIARRINESLPNFNSKNVTIGVSNEKKSKTKYTLRKYNSENFKIISKKHKTNLPLVQKFVPLRKSLLDSNSKNFETSLDSKKSDDNSDSDKNSNLTNSKTENDKTKETHAKLSTGNQVKIINTKKSIQTFNGENNEKLQVKNVHGKTSMTKKESLHIKIDGLIKPRKRLKKKSQNNLILLSTSFKNLSIYSNESPKNNNNSSNNTSEQCNNQVAISSNENIDAESFINQITTEQCNNQVAISSNENIGAESSINQISNSDSEVRNRPIIIENVIAPPTKKGVETLETTKSDKTSDEDSNKIISDLKSNYNTRQLRKQRKRKYKTGKNNSIVILDSPPNKKIARNNKTKKIQNHISNSIDTNNDTIHSVSSSVVSNKTNLKSKKCTPSKLDNNSSSMKYDNDSSSYQNNSSNQKTINYSSKNEKQNDESITQITQTTNFGSESDKSINANKTVETKSNIWTKRNLKQKSVMLSMETTKSNNTSDEDSNKIISDLKSNYNTRQLRKQRKRKYKAGKNNSIVILDSPPNKKIVRNNKTKKIQNHISNSIDTNNDTIHSVSSSVVSNKTNSKSKKCTPSKLDSNSSSVQYDNDSSSNQNNSTKRKPINNSSKNEKQNDESITQITQTTNFGSEADKSVNVNKTVKTKSNIRTRRNIKQKSLIPSMDKSLEKRKRISKNRSPQLKSPKSSHLIPEAESINSENSTSDCVDVTDHNLIENNSNQINAFHRSSYVTARRNSKKKSKILLDENDKLSNKSDRLLESKSPQINLDNSSFSNLMNLEPESEIPSEIFNISDKSTKNLSDNNSNINLNDTDTVLRTTIDSKKISKCDSKQKSLKLSENKDEPLREKSRILKPCISRLKSKKSISFIKLPLNEIDQNSINISSKDAGFVQRNSNVTSRRNSKQKLSSQTKIMQIDPDSTNRNSNESVSVQRISNVITKRNSKQKLSSENDQSQQIQITKILNNSSLNSQNTSKIMQIDPELTNKISNDSGLVPRISNVTTRRNSKQKLSSDQSKQIKTSKVLNNSSLNSQNTSKIIQIDPELTNAISNYSDLVQRRSNVTTRRNSKQKRSSENNQSKQIKTSKVLNSSNDSQNSSVVDLENSVIKDKANISDTNPLKSIILNKTQSKDPVKLNVSAIQLSPEVSNYRNVRQKSIEHRRKFARSKVPSIIGKLKESIPEDPPCTKLTETVNSSLNKPNKFTKLKNCKVHIKKNKNIKNNLIYKPTKDSIHRKHFENNTLKVSKQQERLSVKNHRKKLPIKKCKIPLLKTKMNSKHFINPEKSYNHTISEIQLNKSILNNDSKTITIVDSHNSTAITTTTDNSVMEISFDRDEFIKNINDHHIKKSLLQHTTYIKSIKQSSLSRHNSSNDIIGSGNVADVTATSGPLIDISNITIRDLINQRKSDHRNSSSLNIKSKNITLKDTIRSKNSAENSVNNKFNLIYDILYEDLEEIQNNNNSQLLLLNQSAIINNDDKIQLRLSGGKWRRSLYAWRRNSISLMGKINSSQIINTELQLQQNLSGDINKKVEISNKENTECINSDTNDTIRNSLILSSQIFNKSNSIRKESNKNLRSLSLAQTSLKDNEINFNVSQQRSSFLRKTLLLEPTDDEAPIIHKSCSLFNTFEKQSKLSSSSGNEAAETAASCGQEKQSLQLQNQQYLQQRTQTQQQQQQQQNFIEKSSSLLLQRQSKQKPPSSTSAVYTEIVEETEEEEEELHIEDDDSEYNQSDGDVEYFNDRRILNKNTNKSTTTTNSNNKQKSDEIQNFLYVQRRATQSSNHQQRTTSYQHQLSVPICGNRPSISILGQPSNRRRRTSFIEGFVDFNYHQEQRFLIDNFIKQSTATVVEEVEGGKGTTRVEETKQLQKSNLHNKSSSRYIGTYENNENHIFLPTLDVSLRAQLSPRDIVLRRCQQTDPFEFSSIYSESVLHQCRKIGEGVYGEVFMNKNPNGEAIVLKIIPIEGQIEINGEVQKNFEQILPEIIIAEELSRLRNDKKSMTSGFVEVKNVHCVQGCYPDHLIDLWELYRDNCGTENDHPEIFPEDQLYIIFELANAGQDLEAFNFQNALQSYSAFLQVALSLAVAEEKFKFEHRDLHWGNILLQSTEQKEIYFKLNGKDYKIPTHGVKATIIDYTLSRMIFEGCCLYNDLSNDNELFSASGDYQFDVYRLMQKRLDNQWENYDPYTNILWLHYTIDKMISGARYRCSKTKKHRSAIQTIMKLRDELLDYNSASDYVESFDD